MNYLQAPILYVFHLFVYGITLYLVKYCVFTYLVSMFVYGIMFPNGIISMGGEWELIGILYFSSYMLFWIILNHSFFVEYMNMWSDCFSNLFLRSVWFLGYDGFFLSIG